jgi:hypothetical protein
MEFQKVSEYTREVYEFKISMGPNTNIERRAGTNVTKPICICFVNSRFDKVTYETIGGSSVWFTNELTPRGKLRLQGEIDKMVDELETAYLIGGKKKAIQEMEATQEEIPF